MEGPSGACFWCYKLVLQTVHPFQNNPLYMILANLIWHVQDDGKCIELVTYRHIGL